LKVVGFPQGEEYVPSVRVAGKWLKEFGFDFGSETILTATEGQIVITAKGGESDGDSMESSPCVGEAGQGRPAN